MVINLEQHQHTLGLILNSSKDNLKGALPTLNTPINSKKGREYEVKGGGWGMRLKQVKTNGEAKQTATDDTTIWILYEADNH